MRRVKELFNAYAKEYDPGRSKVIPCFHDFYSTVTRVLEIKSRCPVIVDLGAGTGIVSFGLRKKFPRARIVLADLSEEMLAVAREKFKGDRNIEFITADYFDMSFIEKADAVVSGLSTHHFTDQQKTVLYKNIYRALRPGGMFINADLVKGETPAIDAMFKQIWLERMFENGATKEQVRRRSKNMKIDKPALLADNLEWLEKAGFREVLCYYKYFNFAVFGAKK